jgi:proteasome lid subunit RPN8/RPN11
MAELRRHAEAAYPEECCGFVRRSGAVHRAANVQGTEPAIAGRSAERAFTLGARDLLALNASFRGSDPATCFYHSHPDAGAYFSATDRREALYAGRPKYPVAHLVISVLGGRSVEAALFDWDGTDFECVGRADLAALPASSAPPLPREH